MNEAYARADGESLLGVERDARTGRRITARRARKQKRRAQHAPRTLSIGRRAVPMAAVVGVAVVLLTTAVGAVVVLGGGKSHPGRKVAGGSTSTTSGSTTTSAGPVVKGIYVRYSDAATKLHYMYCTTTAGCGVLDVAANGTSKIAIQEVGGVWHRAVRSVLPKLFCTNVIQNGVNVGRPGRVVMTATTDLRPTGTKEIKGIAVPARIVGTVVTHFDTPEQPGCTFQNFVGGTTRVDSSVTEYVPKPAR